MMRRLAAPIAVALLTASCAVAGETVPATPAEVTCKLRHAMSEVNSLDEMPAPIVMFVRSKTGGMAGRGEFFNVTDSVSRPAPFHRFIRAGHAGDMWLLWYERGGIAYGKDLAVLALNWGSVRLVAHIEYYRHDPCALNDAILDGRIPPETGQSNWW